MYRAIIVVLFLIAGCGGGNPSGTATTPPIVVPPPPPPPPMCEWDDTIPADDPACVQPDCTFTFEWTNPTHREEDEDGVSHPLEVDELKAATLYQFRIPMAAPEEADVIIDAGDPYTVMYTVLGIAPGDWWFTMTVSNTDIDGNLQASDHSNETMKHC